jgi:hypothetical protein
VPRDVDADQVAGFLRKQFGLVAARVPESAARTADLAGTTQEAVAFVCEVKTIAAVERLAPADGDVHCLGRDNAVLRVIAKIDDAHSQLVTSEAVRILALLNRAPLVDVLDLNNAFQGYLDYDTPAGEFHHREISASLTDAFHRIEDKKREIDVYVWINDRPLASDEVPYCVRVHSPRGAEFAERILGLSRPRSIA